jgi:hypothetical protein
VLAVVVGFAAISLLSLAFGEREDTLRSMVRFLQENPLFLLEALVPLVVAACAFAWVQRRVQRT